VLAALVAAVPAHAASRTSVTTLRPE